MNPDPKRCIGFRFHAARCFAKPAQYALYALSGVCRSTAERGRLALWGIVECHPVFGDPSSLEAIVDFVEVDGLLLRASPEPFNEDSMKMLSR